MKFHISFLIQAILFTSAFAQDADYQTRKQQALAKASPFEQIVKRELPATIEYEDDEIIAFLPLRLQAPVHILIVPKKRIPTMNDMVEEDIPLVGKMFHVARQLAKEKGIDESGYRLSINTNEDSGQSVFHIHLHLLGGKKLGPMVDQ
ncbi:MAG: histidine triad nucleotide-binding protein [Cyclobacteriaceae bacterium]